MREIQQAHLSYIKGPDETPLLTETIGMSLRRTVEYFGDREALVVPYQGYRATYTELWDEVTRAAKGLMALGVKHWDRVGIWSPNRYEWVVLQFASARVGATLVNINPAYRAVELEYALKQSEVHVLFLARRFRDADFPELLRQALPGCPELRNAIVIDDDWAKMLLHGETTTDHALAARELALDCGDAVNIQYTSGTTGFPKGATLSHHNILNNAYFVGERLGYTEKDRVCIPVPFYHCFGMVMGNLACAAHGACMVIPGEGFDPLSVLQTVNEERCTSLYGVPTMFIAELEHPRFAEFDLSSLRTGIMAGSLCPSEVLKAVRTKMHMDEITVCYGMTETSPVSLQSRPHDPAEKRSATVGTIHPHLEVKIVSPDTGVTVPRGDVGELCTRGYSVMIGYWHNDEATHKAIDSAHWMHTGDLAVMDASGYVSVVGRIKDMIIRGGENIYPKEVEEFLHTHPGVADVQVIGIPSAKYGEEVMAWVKPRLGATLTAVLLDDYCRGRISTFKVPRYWKIVDSFPLTVTGKVQKFRMRELAIAELGLTLK